MIDNLSNGGVKNNKYLQYIETFDRILYSKPMRNSRVNLQTVNRFFQPGPRGPGFFNLTPDLTVNLIQYS